MFLIFFRLTTMQSCATLVVESKILHIIFNQKDTCMYIYVYLHLDCTKTSVEFESTFYSVSSGTTLAVKVVRNGPLEGALSVPVYATSISAIPGN